MKNIILDLQYLPKVEYFVEIVQANNVLIEAHESYQKQTYRNRTKILSSNKIIDLSIPIQNGRQHSPIRDVKIEYKQKWYNQHTRSIVSSYGKSPFFEHYWDYLKIVFEKKPTYLFDFNWDLLTTCLKLLRIKSVNQTESYVKKYSIDTEDLRSVYSPKNKETPIWHYSYHQIFGNKFEESMSIIDLLFCMGPESIRVLKSAKRRNAS